MQIYDSIHGYIQIEPYIQEIIDTEEFQRLRNIKQTGYCYYVFPGASNNRFEHSIGVYYLAKKYINILNEINNASFNNEYTKLICVGALIHDIGHGPFSHLFDELTNSNHEYRSIEIFKYMNIKYNLKYSTEQIEFISNIIYPNQEYINKFKSNNENQYGYSYMFDIVSNKNGIDVDRMDYIMRDIKSIGLHYGIDYETIMKNSLLSKSGIIYKQKINHVIENFYKTRYILYKDIYNHKTVRLLEHMIKLIIQNSTQLNNIKQIINENKWDEFINLNDNIIDEINNSSNNELSKQIINQIKKRKLYKLFGEIELNYKLDIYNSNNDIIIDESIISYYSKSKPKYYTSTYYYSNTISRTEEDKYLYKIFHNPDSIESINNANEIYNMVISEVKESTNQKGTPN